MHPDNKNPITVRPAREGDLPEILRIESESFPSPWEGPMYMAELHRDIGIFLAAADGAEMAGYLCALTVADEGHIFKMAVDPNRRRQGIGKKLIEAFEDKCLKCGIAVIWLEARSQNHGALEFYLSLGFKPEGLRPRYYSDTGEDAVVMAKWIK